MANINISYKGLTGLVTALTIDNGQTMTQLRTAIIASEGLQSYYYGLVSIIKNGVNWYNLSHNPKTTFGFILENANKSFDWKYLSHIADPKTIKDYPSVLWDMDEFSEFADVDLEYVKANEDICWSWRGLSKNKNFSWKTIEANKDKSWYWHIVFSMKSYNNRESVIEELGDDEPIKV